MINDLASSNRAGLLPKTGSLLLSVQRNDVRRLPERVGAADQSSPARTSDA
jgi:hypothetical protein